MSQSLTISGTTLSIPEWINGHHQFPDTGVAQFLNEWISMDQELTVNTSGSTGKPKPVQLEKSAMVKSAEHTIAHFNLDPGIHALLCLPVKYIAGKMMLVRAIVGDWNLTCIAPSSNPLLEQEKPIAFAAMTPFQVETILEQSPEKMNLIHTLIIGGAPVSFRLRQKLNTISARCYATYGMTETITHIATQRLNGNEAQVAFQALPGVKFWQDERGCLSIKATHLKETIRTNDVVELLDFQNFIWKGRLDNVINSGGVKLFPEEIEAKLAPMFDRRYYIRAREDDKLGERTELCIEGSELDERSLTLLKLTMKEELTSYEYPSSITYVEQFEETETGKVIRT